MSFLRNDDNGKIILPKFGSIGAGLKFDGVNDSVFISPISDNFNFGGSNFTQVAIVKFLSFNPANGFVLNVRQPTFGNASTYCIFLDINGLLYCFVRDTSNNSIINTYTVSLNTLYNIVVVKNSTTQHLYINGVLINSVTNNLIGNINTPTANLLIGGQNLSGDGVANSQFQNMIMYDAKLFSKALTQSEITLLYNSNNNLMPNTAYPNLVVNYNFNQKQGTSLIDSSGNSLTGTLINYTGSDTTLGVGNKWVDENGNPILS